MTLTINGQIKELNGIQNIAGLIEKYCPNKRNIIAELNGAIISSNTWDSTSLKDGDAVELVAFVGGG